jgi:hypothetical protein
MKVKHPDKLEAVEEPAGMADAPVSLNCIFALIEI